MLKRLWLCLKRDAENLWFLVLVVATALALFAGGVSTIAHFVNRSGTTPEQAYWCIAALVAILLVWALIYGRCALAIRRFWLQFEEFAPISPDDRVYVEKHIAAPAIRLAAVGLGACYKEQENLRKELPLAAFVRAGAIRERLKELEQLISQKKKYYYGMLDAANSRLLPFPYTFHRDYKFWLT